MMLATRTTLVLSTALFLLLLHSPAFGAEPDIAGIIESSGLDPATAALLIVRLDNDSEWSSGAERIDTRYSPASTAKIPHTLIALETGYADNAEMFFKWDGKSRFVREWNGDQTLASAYQNSVVWVYQAITQGIGFETMASWIRKLDYGNADTGSEEDLTSYWLAGPLQISAREQVHFLRRLVQLELPVSTDTLQKGKGIMRAETGDNWAMYAKTGWGLNESGPGIGWYVGWVENEDTGTYLFALNLDVLSDDDLAKRKTTARAVLTELGAFSK